MKGISDPKRIPRKLKKEIKNIFGKITYKMILYGKISIKPNVLSTSPKKNGFGWNEKWYGDYKLFSRID